MSKIYIVGVFCITFLNIQFKEVNCNKYNDLIKVVVDFVDSQKLPVKVSSFLCWNSKILVNLMKQMNNKNIPISINYVSTQINKHIHFSPPAEHQLYLLDLDCEYAENILGNANKNYLLKPPFRWILLKSCRDEYDFSQYKIPLNTRIYIINKCKNEKDQYDIDSIYNHMKNNSVMQNKVAVWNNGFKYNKRISDFKDRVNQFGLDINISHVILYKESEYDLEHMRERKKDPITKHNYMLMICLLDILNATATFTSRNKWGTPDPKTRKFDGMVGDIIHGTSQIGGTPIFLTSERMPFVDYLADTTPTLLCFNFRAPPLSTVTNIFRLPFGSMVWLACSIMLSIILFVMYCIIKWEWSEIKYQKVHGSDKNGVLKSTLMDIVQLEIGAICQQGSNGEPKSTSGRIGFFFLLLSLMFLYTAYSANIVALLQSTTDSLKTLKDLVEANIEFGAENISYNYYHFKNQKEHYQKIVYNRIYPDGFVGLSVGVEKMRTEFYAFLAENSAIYKRISDTFQEQEKCGLTVVKYWNLVHPWICARKNSTFKEIFKISLQLIIERGIRDRSFKRMYEQKPVCQNQGANFKSVSINDCYFAVIIFVAGLLLSVIILLIEKGMERKQIISKIKSNYLRFANKKK